MRASSRGMTSAVSDPFERFASECELRVSVAAISLAPRDVLASPIDADEYFLVTLTGARAEAGSIHLLIVIPRTDKRAAPTARDAVWWLAADAWVIERADGDIERWASTYGYPLESAATKRLFERQLRQTSMLRALLCGNQYQQLL